MGLIFYFNIYIILSAKEKRDCLESSIYRVSDAAGSISLGLSHTAQLSSFFLTLRVSGSYSSALKAPALSSSGSYSVVLQIFDIYTKPKVLYNDKNNCNV